MKPKRMEVCERGVDWTVCQRFEQIVVVRVMIIIIGSASFSI